MVAANKVNNSIEVSCRIRYFIANYGQNHTFADCGGSSTDSKLKKGQETISKDFIVNI